MHTVWWQIYLAGMWIFIYEINQFLCCPVVVKHAQLENMLKLNYYKNWFNYNYTNEFKKTSLMQESKYDY